MNYKTVIIISVTSILVIISIWGFLTKWNFFSFTDNYTNTNPENIKKEILRRAEKNSVDFPKKFHTVIQKDNEFIEIFI